MFTALGLHTYTMFIIVSWYEIVGLLNDFKAYRKIDKHLKQPYPKDEKIRFTKSDGSVKEVYSWYKVEYDEDVDRGVRWELRFFNNYNFFIVEVTINPRNLLGENDYLSISDESYFDKTVETYNTLAAKISPHLRCFELYRIKRVDPCLNIDTEELRYPCSKDQLMILLKQGNIPNGFAEPYNNDSHRRGYKNSFYLVPKSKSGKKRWLRINCYSKYHELLENSPDNPCLEYSKNIIRFEPQCKQNKVRELRKFTETKLSCNRPTIQIDGLNFTSPISESEITRELLSDKTMKSIIYKEFHRTILGGDYYSLRHARKKIDSLNICSSRKSLMTWAVELVNRYHGIYKAKQQLQKEMKKAEESEDKDVIQKAMLDSSRFYYALGYLVDNDINPVTIPNGWNIPYMPGLFKAYEAFSKPYNLE